MKTGFVRLFVCGIFICSHSEEPLKLCCSCACCGSYGYKESMFYYIFLRQDLVMHAFTWLRTMVARKRCVDWLFRDFNVFLHWRKIFRLQLTDSFLKELRPASNARHLSLITKHAILIIHSSTYIHLQSLFFGKYQSM